MIALIEDYIEGVHLNCIVDNDFQYAKNNSLSNIIYALFKLKAKNGVIFVIKMALCYLMETYGLNLLTLPV